MIYVIGEACSSFVKIGFAQPKPEWSLDAVRQRLYALQVGNPRELRLLGAMHGTRQDERNLHRRFTDSHVSGEWFDTSAHMASWIEVARIELERLKVEHAAQEALVTGMSTEQRAASNQAREQTAKALRARASKTWSWRGRERPDSAPYLTAAAKIFRPR
jgi:hypothetical protein